LDAWCLESGEVAPVGTGPFRVEDDGTQVEISEEEMDEALGTSFTGLTGAEDVRQRKPPRQRKDDGTPDNL
jgi:hypothetical protein